MSEHRQLIIDRIRLNRISTTEIADCLNKTGAVPLVSPVNKGHFQVGPVFWAYAFNESNWEVHEQLREVKPGDVVLVETFDCGDRAIFGELVAKFVLLYRQAAAIVVQGKLRDVPRLLKENWSIWSTGGTPIGCFNRRNEEPFPADILAERKARYEGAIAVCDDSGVVIIPAKNVGPEFLEKLAWIEEQEDLWFDCVDRRKWDTFDTVCLKKYKQPEQ